jgi:hypothetical protein
MVANDAGEFWQSLQAFDALIGVGTIPDDVAKTPYLFLLFNIRQHSVQSCQVGMDVRDDQCKHG